MLRSESAPIVVSRCRLRQTGFREYREADTGKTFGFLPKLLCDRTVLRPSRNLDESRISLCFQKAVRPIETPCLSSWFGGCEECWQCSLSGALGKKGLWESIEKSYVKRCTILDVRDRIAGMSADAGNRRVNHG